MKSAGEGLWLKLLGENTNVGTLRFLGIVAVFIALGGTAGWLLI